MSAAASPPKQACGYVRVSTEDQAAHGTSIGSQIQKIGAYCEAHGYELVEIFEEPGLSGKDEGRPKFNRMLNLATSAARPYDAIVVYSLSRFARDLAVQTVSYKRLVETGVQLLSVVEKFEKGATGNLMRSVVGAFNQHTSDQCSMNTIRTMNENAAQGFYNGGPVPFGYRSVTVEVRKGKEKKKLQIHDEEAEVVRRIFRLARYGDGQGPMGARAIAQWLNERGFRLKGGKFNNSNTAGILGRTHYVGYYLDGKQNDFGEPVPPENWISVPCPPIVTEEEFLDAAALRAQRSPRVTAPRVTNGVTMLPGSIARCGQPGCGAGLTPRSGKGGRYYYYTCWARANEGAVACDLPAIRRDQLDEIVLNALGERIFEETHMRSLLSSLLDRSDETEKRRRKDLRLVRAEATAVSKAITNLLIAVEGGTLRPDDPLFVERMSHNQARKRALEADQLALERQLSSSKKTITDDTIQLFARRMREHLLSGPPQFKAAYVRLFVEKVELSTDKIMISGAKAALERALVQDEAAPPGAVPIFDREWCRLGDSNT